MKKIFTYQQAKNYAQALNMLKRSDWNEYIKNNTLPPEIPSAPEHFYSRTGEWVSWGDFLGTGTVAPSKREYLSYNDAKEYVKSLNISSLKEWKEYIKNNTFPPEIPRAPEHFYNRSGEWSSWSDFLGTKVK